MEGNAEYKVFICQGCGEKMITSIYVGEKLWCNKCKRKRDNESTYRSRAKRGRKDRKDPPARSEQERCKWPYRYCTNRIAEGNRIFCRTHHSNAGFNSDDELSDGGIYTEETQEEISSKCQAVIQRAKKIISARPTTKVYNAKTMGRVLFGKIVGELYPESGC